MRRVQKNTALEAVLPGPASLDVPVPWGSGRAGSPFGAIFREINLLVRNLLR